jgi:hypothetical protein
VAPSDPVVNAIKDVANIANTKTKRAIKFWGERIPKSYSQFWKIYEGRALTFGLFWGSWIVTPNRKRIL